MVLPLPVAAARCRYRRRLLPVLPLPGAAARCCRSLIEQPTVSEQQQQLLLILCMPVTVSDSDSVKKLIQVGTIFRMLVANERVSLDKSDIRAVREVTGVFDKRYVIFLPIK